MTHNVEPALTRTDILHPKLGLEELRHRLQAAGLRPTRQRLALAHLLFGNGDRHFTAEQLFQEALEQKYPPSFATIYNTLHQFAAHGLVREIALYGSRLWYDTKTGPHYHFYIEDRDELIDIPEQMIPDLNIIAPEGLKITGVDVVVRVKSLPEGYSA
jgi:Fur family iron response transcriptional regulator